MSGLENIKEDFEGNILEGLKIYGFKTVAKEYFLYVGEQFREWKEKEYKFIGYYFSNCFLALTKRGPNRTAPGNRL